MSTLPLIDSVAVSPASSDDPLFAALAGRIGGTTAFTAYGTQIEVEAVSGSTVESGVACVLPDLGLLGVTGAQSAEFLQSQLTNDVDLLTGDEAQWNGYCSPKGRLLATFLAWREADGFALSLSRPLAEPIRKRLSMFVLRSKVKLADRSGAGIAIGLIGRRALSVARELGVGDLAAMTHSTSELVSAVGLPAVGDSSAPGSAASLDRIQLWVAHPQIDAVLATIRAQIPFAGTSLWHWAEIHAGIPRIVSATSEKFVPQMVNFELIGGVSFTKGCYPGQEIVARSQYLGKLKRRMFIGHVSGNGTAGLPVDPGVDIRQDGAAEPCGVVVLAAPSPHGGVDLLFESTVAAADSGRLIVADQPIERRVLPYSIEKS